jgi:uncharacterized cupin superfamily protein
MVAKETKEIAALSVSGYPEPYRSRVLPREVRRLGDVFGLTAIGVSHVTIFPGKESSMRHHHTHEDELIYMLEGELVLHTDAGEETLRPGMVVGFRAGEGNGHHMINRSGANAAFLVMSNRHPEDGAAYPDIDLAVKKGADGKYAFTRKDGGPVEPT